MRNRFVKAGYTGYLFPWSVHVPYILWPVLVWPAGLLAFLFAVCWMLLSAPKQWRE
jgi:hypothetical protein